jgi:PEGA domain
MKRFWTILLLAVAGACCLFAQTPWQYARIVSVNKSVKTRTKVWLVNTPINEDETTFTVAVHVQDKIIVGTYDLTPEESPPPEEWTTNYPVEIQLTGDRLYLRAPTGDVTLHVVRRKPAKLMTPLTVAEKKQLAQLDVPASSLVGFAPEKATGATASAPAESAPAPAPAPLPPTMGSVTVRSTPYLSEVFVDGDSMGYTPAKVSLPPGKHTFRVEKSGYLAWTKEITITVGSELTLDATLEKK